MHEPARSPLPMPLAMFFPPERIPQPPPPPPAAIEPAAAAAPPTPESHSDRMLPVPIALNGAAPLQPPAYGHPNGNRGDVMAMLDALDIDEDERMDEELAPDAFCCPITHVRPTPVSFQEENRC